MVKLEKITKKINKNTILDNVCLTVDFGEFFVILGPSGSGKTSLLNVIAGLLKEDSGTLWVGGRDVTKIPPNKRNIGMVFQNFHVYPHLDVAENIRFPLRYKNGNTEKESSVKVHEVAALLNISHLLRRKSYELSGGEKQRVALARAIVKSPVLFLLDEPLSNLDYQLRLKIREELKNLHKTLNKTFIYVTHDQAEAFYLADRVAILDSGRIIQIGTPKEILKTPNSLFLAEFVNSYYNKIPITISQEKDGTEFAIQAGRLVIGSHAPERLLTEARPGVVAFIKCQDIFIEGERGALAQNNLIWFEARIKDILYVSELQLLLLENGLRMTTLSADFNPGDWVKAGVGKGNVLLFEDQRLIGSLG